MNRRVFLIAILLMACFEPALKPASVSALQSEPTVRIGLNQNAATITVRSTQTFTVQGQATRTAKFSVVLSVNPSRADAPLRKEDLQYRMVIELDDGRVLAPPLNTTVRIDPPATRLQIGDRSYRGVIEMSGNSRNTLTIVNELPLEQYLLGVVPNELSPTTFGQLEALKAQAVAARTYIVRNLGQYKREGYDICDTDACQVYFGAGTEHPLATRAVEETRGIVATYDGRPINALYSSTCGGRTESAENIFEEKAPYLVSVMCEYKHPEPKPFSTALLIANYEDAVLKVANVSTFAELGRFLGLPGGGEPSGSSPAELAAFIRSSYYPNVKPAVSDLEFLQEQGILSASGLTTREVLFKLIEKKSAFEWQQGVLTEWDGRNMKLMVNGQPKTYPLSESAPIFQRIGDDRIGMQNGSWIGGELIDFRVVGDVIQMAVYRRNFVNPSADRYSRLAMWQVHKTKSELDAAFNTLNIGSTEGMRVVERGDSERLVSTEISGSRGKQTLRALRLRTLLGLRDSLFYFDEERNSRGELIGMSFYGSGWGHGVGMCQVGAFGMALDGATYDEILKKYYTGIDLQKTY